MSTDDMPERRTLEVSNQEFAIRVHDDRIPGRNGFYDFIELSSDTREEGLYVLAGYNDYDMSGGCHITREEARQMKEWLEKYLNES